MGIDHYISSGSLFRSLHPIKYYRDYLAHNIRPDGRELDKFRPIVLNAGNIRTADGSAVVKVGRTTVVCGVKAVSTVLKKYQFLAITSNVLGILYSKAGTTK